MPSAADLIARRLYEAGCRHAFGFPGGELATLRDLKLAVIVVVFIDASLALIEMKQRGARLTNLGVDLGTIDFRAVATAFGGHGTDVRDAAALEQGLAGALDCEGFTLLACHIEQKSYNGLFLACPAEHNAGLEVGDGR